MGYKSTECVHFITNKCCLPHICNENFDRQAFPQTSHHSYYFELKVKSDSKL